MCDSAQNCLCSTLAQDYLSWILVKVRSKHHLAYFAWRREVVDGQQFWKKIVTPFLLLLFFSCLIFAGNELTTQHSKKFSNSLGLYVLVKKIMVLHLGRHYLVHELHWMIFHRRQWNHTFLMSAALWLVLFNNFSLYSEYEAVTKLLYVYLLLNGEFESHYTLSRRKCLFSLLIVSSKINQH